MKSDFNAQSDSADLSHMEDNDAFYDLSIDKKMPKSRFIGLICGISAVTIFCICCFAIELWQRNTFIEEKQQLEQDLADYQHYISELPGMRQEFNEISFGLEKNRAELKSIAAEYDAKKQAYDEAVAVLARYEDLKAEVGELNASKVKLTNELASLQADKQTLNKEITSLRNEQTTLKRTASSLTDEVNGLLSKKEATEIELTSLEKRFAALKQEDSSINVLTKSLSDMQTRISGIINDYMTVNDKLNDQLDENEPNSIAHYAKNIRVASEQFNKKVNDIAGQKNTLDTVLNNYSSEYRSYTQLHDSLTAEIKALQAKNEQLQQVDFTGTNSKLASSAENISTAITNLNQLVGTNDRHNAPSNSQEKQVTLSSMLDELVILREQVVKTAANYQSAVTEINNKTNLDPYTQQLQRATDAFNQQNTQLNAIIASLAESQQKVSAAVALQISINTAEQLRANTQALDATIKQFDAMSEDDIANLSTNAGLDATQLDHFKSTAQQYVKTLDQLEAED